MATPRLDDLPPFPTLAEVARALGMSRDKLRDLETKDPTFPARRPLPFQELKRFRLGEIKRWVAAQETPAEVGA